MRPNTLQKLRRWHLYVGVFLAPSILFFAFSGFIQVVGWQDQRNPPPPGWVSWMAGIHKHQAVPKPRPAAPAKPAANKPQAAGEKHDGEHEDHDKGFSLLKPFALLTALGLLVSTLIGLAVALGTPATRRRSGIVLAAGVVVPVLLLVL